MSIFYKKFNNTYFIVELYSTSLYCDKKLIIFKTCDSGRRSQSGSVHNVRVYLVLKIKLNRPFYVGYQLFLDTYVIINIYEINNIV